MVWYLNYITIKLLYKYTHMHKTSPEPWGVQMDDGCCAGEEAISSSPGAAELFIGGIC